MYNIFNKLCIIKCKQKRVNPILACDWSPLGGVPIPTLVGILCGALPIASVTMSL